MPPRSGQPPRLSVVLEDIGEVEYVDQSAKSPNKFSSPDFPGWEFMTVGDMLAEQGKELFLDDSGTPAVRDKTVEVIAPPPP